MRGNEFAELTAFGAVAEHGSFVRAAGHLRVSPSALSQTIRGLEERLGVRLLHRTTRSVALTDAGARLLARLKPAMSELESAVDDVTRLSDKPAGVLRINTARTAAIRYLAPLAARFNEAYPDVVLELIADDDITDIVAGGFDAGVRLGERLAKDMVAVRLSRNLQMTAAASPRYLARYGTPTSPRDLHRHRCVNWRWSSGVTYRWEFQKGTRSMEVAVEGPLVVNDPAVAVRAAIDGIGIVYLTSDDVEAAIASGELVRVLAPWSPSFPGFWLYYPSRKHVPPQLRAFADFVRKEVGAAGVR